MPNWLDVGKVPLVACLGPRTERWIAALEAGKVKVKVGARREPVVDADGLILLVQCACRT